MTDPLTYGLLAEFAEPEQLVRATRRAYEEGYRRIDAYTPFPVHGLAPALGFHRSSMPLVVLLGGVVGGIAGYGLQYWASAIAYPLNIGGRPLNSWPSFVPITFECTVLLAALAGVLGMLALNGLPRPHHPLFAEPAFARATMDRFFLCIESTDPKYHAATTRSLLESFQPLAVYEVPNVPL